MEESLTYLKEQFKLPDVDVKSYSPLVLAYIGDGIYELVIRTAVVGQGNQYLCKGICPGSYDGSHP